MKKGSVRFLMAILIVLVFVASWYTMYSDYQKAEAEYNSALKLAREKRDAGLVEVAEECYKATLALRDTVELRDEIAQFYLEYADQNTYLGFCEELISLYPTEAVGYERLLKLYHKNGEYASCFSIINSANKRKIDSKTISNIAAEIAYKYRVITTNVANVQFFSSGACAVQKADGMWGFVDSLGNMVLGFAYEELRPFTNSGLAAVKKKDSDFCLVDASGVRRAVDTQKRNIEDCTSVLTGMIAVKYNGKWHYCDADLKELFGSYDYAGGFNCGVAAVVENGEWRIINTSGKVVGNEKYEEIVVDDKGIAFRNNQAFAKKNGKYILINTEGKQIGNSSWEAVDAFSSNQPAAVKNGGKWGYLDASGKIVVDYQYEDAKSFCNGFAAVKVSSSWGYIVLEDYSLKIDAEFSEAKDFSTSGTAFVQKDDKWCLLKIYRLAV